MQTQSLKERIARQKEKLAEIAETARGLRKECGRDTGIPEPQFTGPLNWQKGWDKGWGKYGKT